MKICEKPLLKELNYLYDNPKELEKVNESRRSGKVHFNR